MIAFTTWVGDNPQLPLDYAKNILSWKQSKNFSDIRIFTKNDVEIKNLEDSFPFLAKWRKAKKLALCADFLRYAIPKYVYDNHITCYMDADVSVVNSFGSLNVNHYDFITAKEDSNYYGASILISTPPHRIEHIMVKYYEDHNEEIFESFKADDPLKTLTAPKILTKILNEHITDSLLHMNLIDDVSVFYPVFPWTEDGSIFSNQTLAIHWNDGAWIKNKIDVVESEEEISTKMLKNCVLN